MIPTLSVTIRDNLIIVECNEVGFSAANVEAICRIGASTKKNKKGFIGRPAIYSFNALVIIDHSSVSQARRVSVSVGRGSPTTCR